MAGHKAKLQRPERYGIKPVEKKVEVKPKKKSIFKKKKDE